jgi:hypothetical protein
VEWKGSDCMEKGLMAHCHFLMSNNKRRHSTELGLIPIRTPGCAAGLDSCVGLLGQKVPGIGCFLHLRLQDNPARLR